MGNIYSKQRRLTEQEIVELAAKIKVTKEHICFDDEVISATLFKQRLARKLDPQSKLNLIRHLAQTKTYQCKYCGSLLGQDDLSYARWPLNDGFKDKCQTCISHQQWKRGKFPVRAQKISNAKKRFYESDLGKQTAIDNGKKISTALKVYYTTQDGIDQKIKRGVNHSNTLRTLIADGKFKPGIHNYWTHWDAIVMIDGCAYKFRSSWEACFFICHQHLEYETIRIPYEKDNKQLSYIPDFYDPLQKIIYEIKPRSRFKIEKVKMNAAMTWCIANDIRFVHLDETTLTEHLDKNVLLSCNEYKIQWDKAKETLCIN